MTTRPIVFVVDADASVRDTLERLIDRSGWPPKAFPSAKDFLAQPRIPAATYGRSERRHAFYVRPAFAL